MPDDWTPPPPGVEISISAMKAILEGMRRPIDVRHGYRGYHFSLPPELVFILVGFAVLTGGFILGMVLF